MNRSESTLQRVTDFIFRHHLIQDQERILMGISGGVDSLVLADALHCLGYSVQALHCNFQLRGEESERDERHTIHFCQQREIPCSTIRFNTTEFARQRGISIEMAARKLRYDHFRTFAQTNNFQKIAVGHHTDDSIETFLLNLVRGAGIKGLTGIKPLNGTIIRPLLCLNRNEILEYAAERGIEYVTDSSNNDSCYQRNKLRIDIIPRLKEINPAAERHILSAAERLTEANDLFQEFLRERISKLCHTCENGVQSIRIQELLAERFPHTLLHEILSPLGFNNIVSAEIVDNLPQMLTGKQFLSTSHMVVKDRDKLLVRPLFDLESPEATIPNGSTSINSPLSLCFERSKYTPTVFNPEAFYADEDKVRYPLRLRKWRKGDSFTPFGMAGKRKKISDFFAENHFSVFEKADTFLLCDRDDEVIWIVGHRTSELVRIDQYTTNILQIRVLK